VIIGAVLIGCDFTPSNSDFNRALKDGHFRNCAKVLLTQGKANINKKEARELYLQLAHKNEWDVSGNLKSIRIKSLDGRLMWSVYPSSQTSSKNPITISTLLAATKTILIMSIICGASSLATGYLAAKVALPILDSIFPSMNNKASALWAILILLISQALYGLMMGVPISLASIYGHNRSRFVGLIFGALMGIGGFLVFRELVSGPFMTARYLLFTCGAIISPAVIGTIAAIRGDPPEALRFSEALGLGVGVTGIGVVGTWFFGIPVFLFGTWIVSVFNITIR